MPPTTLLVVCTANQCRSPLGQVIAGDLAARRGIQLFVASAGTRALAGVPATDGAITTARKLGLDLAEHRSSPVTPQLVEGAHLIVAMERQHVLDLVADHGAPLTRTFTLPELAARLSVAEPRGAHESPGAAVERATAGRTAADVLAAPEIDDPIGRPMRHYRAAAKEITAGLEQVLDALFPAHR